MKKEIAAFALAAALLPASAHADMTPAAFSFSPTGGAEPGTMEVSNTVTVTGIDEVTPIGVTGGEYRIGAGAYTSSAGTVTNQQTVQVRATAGAFEQVVDVVLDIGGVQGTFSVTSRAANSDAVLDPQNRTINVSTNNGTLMNLAQVAPSIYASPAYDYDNGFFDFDITNLTPGATAVVTLTLHAAAAPDAYLKCTASACALFPGASIAGRIVTLTLVDGGPGDSDNLANGVINDPGAPATISSTYIPPGGGGGYSSGGYGGALGGLTVVLGLVLAARRRRGSARV